MAIDRGGLQYRIEIEGNFARQLELFRTELAASRASWQDFRTSLRGISGEAGRVAAAMRQVADAGGAQAQATQEVAAASNELLTDEQALIEAHRSLAREARRLQVIREKELLVAEGQEEIQIRSIAQRRGEAQAARDVTRALAQEIRVRERARIVQELGLGALFATTEAFNAEAVAIERVAAAERKLAVSQALAQRGRDPRGNALTQGPTVPEDIRRQHAAELQFAKELEKLQQRDIVQGLRNQSSEYQRLTARTQEVKKRTDELDKSIEKTDSRANRIAFTFRRLIGILAAFTIARQVVQQFNNMVSAAVRFDAQMEQSRLSLASLLLSAGTVRDGLGNVLQGQEAFNEAQKVANQQIKILQANAQKTTASFEELTTAFQTAAAAGLSNRFTLDQIQELTLLISQAAGALGVADRGFAEEIRSLFTGHIVPGQSRIATFLGISPSDVEQAKQLNNLYGFLLQKLEGFRQGAASQQALLTTQAQAAADSLKALLGAAAEPTFFKSLVNLLRDFSKQIQNETKGILEADPAAVRALQGLFDGLAIGVEALRDVVRNLDFTELQKTFSLLGEALGSAVALSAKLAQFLISGFAPIAQIMRVVIQVTRNFVAELSNTQSHAISVLGAFLKTLLAVEALAVTSRVVWITFKAILGVTKLFSVTLFVVRKTMLLMETIGLLLIKRFKVLELLSKSTLKTFLLGALAAALIAKLLEKLGALEKIAQTLENIVGPLFKEFNALTDRILGINDLAAEGVEKTASVITENLQNLRSQADEILRDLEQKTRESRADRASTLASLGFSGEGAQEVRAFFQAIHDAQEKSLDFSRKEAGVRSEITKLQEDRLKVANKEQALVEKHRAALDLLVDLEKRRRELNRDIGFLEDVRVDKLTDEASRLKAIDISTGRLGKRDSPLADIADTLSSTEDFLRRVGQAEKLITEQRKGFREMKALVEVGLRDVRDVQKELAEATGKEKAAQEALNVLQEQQLRIRREALRAAAQEIGAMARQQEFSLRREAIETKLTLEQNRRLALAEDAQDSNASQQIQLNFDIAKREVALKFQAADIQKEINRLTKIEAELRADVPEETAQILALQRQIGALKQKENLDLISGNAELDLMRTKLQRLKLEREGTFGQGLGSGAQQFAKDNQSLFLGGERFIQDALSGLSGAVSQTVGQSIASAFDPNVNVDLQGAIGNLASSLGAELVDIAFRKILASIIGPKLLDTGADAAQLAAQAAVAQTLIVAGTTLTAAATGFGIAAPVLAGSGTAMVGAATTLGIVAPIWQAVATQLAIAAIALAAAKGGAGFAHGGFVAGGFADGGNVSKYPRHPRPRPKGLDPRDRVPIWARPNEWVMRPEATRYYGHARMAAINSLRVRPEALDAFTGASRFTATSRSSEGFAAGGPVNRLRDRSTDQEARKGSPPPGFVQSFVVNDEQTLDRMLASGPAAMHRFARIHRAEQRAALGLNR